MVRVLDRLLGHPSPTYSAKVEIYTWQICPFCIRAKFLLWLKGVRYTEYKIDGDELARSQMAERAEGRRTLPQIFINDRPIGGCDELYALNQRGELDRRLAQNPA
jgi:glutaredoxin 3